MGSGEDCGPRSALGADQFNEKDPDEAKSLATYFSSLLFWPLESGDCHRRRLRNSYEINAKETIVCEEKHEQAEQFR
ncbi:hypothetical protein DKX38_019168 [Salix brachista]|uniref:Uncharacterized protein n=1 Tax=Salix brachista TaxID=2182728 RepID=A0A5N5KFI8_9ROSI|nr:hypothetical protein DKX38_019168 [Salix brachista]